MTAYVLDTNTVSFLLRREEVVVQAMRKTIQPDDLIIGCPVVWFEIRRGLLAKNATTRLKRFEALFQIFTWQDYTKDDWKLASELWTKRRSEGRPISDADLLIGVFSINRNAVLITDNEKDFVSINIKIQNWKKPD